jgi:hypothetical protein
MIRNMTRILSLFILLAGLALVARSVIEAGSVSLTSGVVAGLAFSAYGAVRLYYTRGKP